MKIRSGDQDLDERETTKLEIPKRLKLKLQALKLIEGKTMSETATEALEEYLADEDLQGVIDGE